MARVARKMGTKTLEQKLWDAADALRGNQEPSEYKHVVLGLVFLKYISDRFEGRRKEIEAELAADGLRPEQIGRLAEDRDEYTSNSVFWVPAAARWGVIQRAAKQPEIGAVHRQCYGPHRAARIPSCAACCRATTAEKTSTRAGSASSST